MNASQKLSITPDNQQFYVVGRPDVAGIPVLLSLSITPSPTWDVNNELQEVDLTCNLWERLHLARMIHQGIVRILDDINLVYDAGKLTERNWYELSDPIVCTEEEPNGRRYDMKRLDVLYARTHFPDDLAAMLQDEKIRLKDRLVCSAVLEILNQDLPPDSEECKRLIETAKVTTLSSKRAFR